MIYGRKLETPEIIGTMGCAKLEKPERRGIPYINDLQTFREQGPFLSGGEVSNETPLGAMSCRVFQGAAGFAGMELARLDRERLTTTPPPADLDPLNARLRRLGINPRPR